MFKQHENEASLTWHNWFSHAHVCGRGECMNVSMYMLMKVCTRMEDRSTSWVFSYQFFKVLGAGCRGFETG